MKRLLQLLIALLAIVTSSFAFAQSDKLAEAKRLFRAGARAYDAGQFSAAVQAFDQAYELSPRPPLRFSAAQALKRQYVTDRDPELLRKAQGYYQEYVDKVKKGRRVKDAVEALGEIDLLLQKHAPKPAPPSGGDDDDDDAAPVTPAPKPTAAPKTTGTLQVDSDIAGAVAVVSGQANELTELPQWLELPPGSYTVTITAAGYDDGTRTVRVVAGRLSLADPPLRAKKGKVKITGDDGADVLVDGKPAGRSPLSLDLDSGAHRIVVGQTGYDIFTEDFVIGRGETKEVKSDLGMTTQRIIAWIVLGGAGVTLSGGIVLALSAASEQRKARDIFNHTNQRPLTVDERDKYNSHISTRDNLARFTGGAFALGGLAAGIGILLLTLDDPDLYAAAAATDDDDENEEGEETKDAPEDDSAVELDASLVPILDAPSPGAALILHGTF